MANLRHLFILLLLAELFLACHGRSLDQQRLYQYLKQQRSADNDNEYVWFTRNIHPDMLDEQDDNTVPNRNPIHADGMTMDFDPNDKVFSADHRND